MDTPLSKSLSVLNNRDFLSLLTTNRAVVKQFFFFKDTHFCQQNSTTK